MNGFRKKYQNKTNGDNKEIKETTTTTTVIETKIERPKAIKVVEEKVIVEKDPFPKRQYRAAPKAAGRASAIFSLKRDNDLIVKTTVRKSSKEKDRAPNNEGGKWRRYYRKEEEKPKDIKVIKEEIIEKKPDTFKPEEKVIKTEIKIVTTKNETPVLNDKDTNNNNIQKEEKVVYAYNRDLLKGSKKSHKTDEDLPKFPKKQEKEVVPVEAKKRRTLATSFIPGSKKLLEEANKKNEEKKNNITINVSLNVNKPEIKVETKPEIKEIEEIKEIKVESKPEIKLETKPEIKVESKPEVIVEKKIEIKVENNPENKPEYIPENKPEKKLRGKKILIIEEQKIPENVNEAEQKEKLNRLKIALNEIEKASADKILKKDLVELFEKVLEDNLEFKDKIFFKNLNHTEKKVGYMDKEEIPHTYKEIETREIIRNMPNADDLMRKYTNRAKRIVEED